METLSSSGRSERAGLGAARLVRPRAAPASDATPELEVSLVQHRLDRRCPPITGHPGKLPRGQPGSLVPGPRLEAWIQMGVLRLEPSLALVPHMDSWGGHL